MLHLDCCREHFPPISVACSYPCPGGELGMGSLPAGLPLTLSLRLLLIPGPGDHCCPEQTRNSLAQTCLPRDTMWIWWHFSSI